MSVPFKPKAYHTITPYLVVEDADILVVFLQAAFDATQTECVKNNEGTTTHTEVKIGDSVIMIGSKPGSSHSHTKLYLYVQDTTTTYQKAIDAGATSIMKPTTQFYGDINAGVTDPAGNEWWIATHIEDVSPEEIEKRAAAFYAS